MRRALLVVVMAACGDSLAVVEPIEAVSGTRIKLERWLYEDGTTHVDPGGFYDTRLNTRCIARRWGDDLVRCVPVAGEALYTDAACTTVVGVAALVSPDPDRVADANVSHFIGYDWIDGKARPMRLYAAGEPATAPGTYYAAVNGGCEGPYGAPSGASYYTVAREIAPTTMPIVDEVELGAGRLALRVLTTTDGLRVPVGLRDRTLDAACTPTARGDGAACEPLDVVDTVGWYADPECATPVVVLDPTEAIPSLVRTVDASGCASYVTVAGETTADTYFRAASGCQRVEPGEGWRTFSLGAEVPLSLLDREIGEAGPRLAPVLLADATDPTLAFFGARLLDRALRAECRREQSGELARCVPAEAATGFTLYEAGCAIPVAVAQVARRTCTPLAFARTQPFDAEASWHAIGEPVHAQLYRNDGSCTPYNAAPDTELRAIGPALPETTFMRALKYGER